MMKLESPSPKVVSNTIKPMVAPETKGNVFLNPYCELAESDIRLTGPGEMDIVRANRHIAIIVDIWNLLVVCNHFNNLVLL